MIVEVTPTLTSSAVVFSDRGDSQTVSGESIQTRKSYLLIPTTCL